MRGLRGRRCSALSHFAGQTDLTNFTHTFIMHFRKASLRPHPLP